MTDLERRVAKLEAQVAWLKADSEQLRELVERYQDELLAKIEEQIAILKGAIQLQAERPGRRQ